MNKYDNDQKVISWRKEVKANSPEVKAQKEKEKRNKIKFVMDVLKSMKWQTVKLPDEKNENPLKNIQSYFKKNERTILVMLNGVSTLIKARDCELFSKFTIDEWKDGTNYFIRIFGIDEFGNDHVIGYWKKPKDKENATI